MGWNGIDIWRFDERMSILTELVQEYENTYKHPKLDFKMPEKPLVDDFIAQKTKSIYETMKRLNCDWFSVIIGAEGSGKTTFTSSYLLNYCLNAQIEFSDAINGNVAFDEFDILRWIAFLDKSKEYYPIWCDEGSNVFFNRNSHSSLRGYTIKFLNTMRILKRFVVICATEFRQLDVILREHRIKSFIRIQPPTQAEIEQGIRIYHYYNYDQLIKLVAYNEGRRDSQYNWRCVESEHSGWFKHSPEIEKLIRQLKDQYLDRFQIEARMTYLKELYRKLEVKRILDETSKESDESSNTLKNFI